MSRVYTSSMAWPGHNFMTGICIVLTAILLSIFANCQNNAHLLKERVTALKSDGRPSITIIER